MRLKAAKERLSSVERNFITTHSLETPVLIIVDSISQVVQLEFNLRSHYHKQLKVKFTL
jgi:hypothetical protein